MEIVRAFFAIDIPIMLEKMLIEITAPLHDDLSLPIRWSPPENLHITLRFIKAFAKEDLPLLIENVKRYLKKVSAFPIQLHQIELFPSPHHLRAIAISLQPNEALDMLVTQIGHGIIATNYTLEERSFRGHLTLGRFNDRPPPHFSLENTPSVERLNMMVNRITFYESRPQASGSRYFSLSEIRLKS